MLKESADIHIVVFVTDEEMTDSFSSLIQSAGMKVEDPDSLDEMLECLMENPAVILPLPSDDRDNAVLDELICTAQQNSSSATCYIITSSELWPIREEFRKFTWQPLRKRTKQRTLDEVEKDHIIKTLDDTKWKYKTAAKILGIDRSTLYRKLKKYKLHRTIHKKG